MELVEGTNLRRYQRTHGVLTAERTVTIASAVALGLGAAHHVGIVHMDVNPSRVLIGTNGSVKLTAFNAKWLSPPNYHSPEQLQGENATPESDVYTLGIVMYEMLTGHTPFDGDTPVAVAMQHIHEAPIPPTQLNPGISSSLEAIILRCLEKVPAERYRDGSQLVHALKR